MASSDQGSAGSAASTPTKEWLCHVPDKPNALQDRLKARPVHLENLTPAINAGLVVFGGATLTKHPEEGETPDMTGSVILIKANSKEEVLEALRNDPNTKGGAWDVDNAKIWPFKCAVRTSM